MNSLPEQEPSEAANLPLPEEKTAREPLLLEPWTTEPAAPPVEDEARPSADPYSNWAAEERPLFREFYRPAGAAQERIPNFGHLSILGVLALCGFVGAGVLTRAALHFHLFGVKTLEQAVNDIHYTLGSEGAFYLLTFLCCLLVFPPVWRQGLFAGLHWRGATALHLSGKLMSAAAFCFVLALVNGLLMPGPSDTPIDEMFRTPGAAWLLLAFGVTMAPFFEELAFRGFLLPALCTAWDWAAGRAANEPARPLDENGHPQWSPAAMCLASAVTSVVFALMHADQTGYSLGPFLLLLCVSLVLCWARLSTRSLAASVLVHACYNFMLFSLMLLGTSGFKHLEKM